MCTAISFYSSPHLFGRNLDLDRRYQESVVCLGREFPFPYRYITRQANRFALFGAATVVEGIPLLYDAVNEVGLYAAGLNFPKSAAFAKSQGSERDLLPHELIPFVLSSCATAREAEELLRGIRLVGESFSEDYPLPKLHFFIADEKECIAAEPMKESLELMKNPASVLTNEPPLASQLEGLYKKVPQIKIGEVMRYPDISASPSSEARFTRSAVCAKMAERTNGERESVIQLFHVLSHVSVVSGTADAGRYHKTVYTSVASHTLRSYYYSTYENPAIRRITFNEENFDTKELTIHPMIFD